MAPRVLYMGTAELACPPLVALHQSSVADVVGVVTQPDRPSGRKLALQPSAVKQCALKLGVPVIQPKSLRNPESLKQLATFEADLFIVTAYGQILSQAALDLPPRGALNVHASLLPRHRGAAPIQWAILKGDATTGITLMRMDAGLDTGDIIASTATHIGSEDTAQTLHDRLSEMGAKLLIESLPGFLGGTLISVPQDDSASTYARKILKQDGLIDWAQPAITIQNKLRAFTPWPGLFTQLPTQKMRSVKIQKVSASTVSGNPGEVISANEQGIWVGCGEGSLSLLLLQREGGRPLNAVDFLNGCPLEPGSRLGQP